MRKVFVVVFAAVFIFSFTGLSFASVDNIYEVAVISMKGDVQVDTNGDGIWIKPWVGMKLMEKAIIKTGDNARIDIVFDAEGLNVVRINSNSTTTVGQAVLELPDGAVLAKFANLMPGSSFTVKTPTAACAIRGSAMGVSVRNGQTNAMSFDGNLYVQGFDENGDPVGDEETIPEGEKTNVDQNGNVGDTEDIDDEDQDAFDDFDSGSGGDDGTDPGELDDVDDETDTKDLDEVRVQDQDDTSQISPTDESHYDESIDIGYEPT